MDGWIGREQIHRVQWRPQLRSGGAAAGVFGARAVQDSRPGRDLLAHRRVLAAVQGDTARHVEGGGDAVGVLGDGWIHKDRSENAVKVLGTFRSVLVLSSLPELYVVLLLCFVFGGTQYSIVVGGVSSPPSHWTATYTTRSDGKCLNIMACFRLSLF